MVVSWIAAVLFIPYLGDKMLPDLHRDGLHKPQAPKPGSLAGRWHALRDPDKAPAYLRSIVLNLARDHNRRGLVSLRHHLPHDDLAGVEDEISLRADQQRVIDALRALPHRQRDCVILRYYDELGIDDIAATLGISRNSVKTHLGRALDALERELAAEFGPEHDAPTEVTS